MSQEKTFFRYRMFILSSAFKNSKLYIYKKKKARNKIFKLISLKTTFTKLVKNGYSEHLCICWKYFINFVRIFLLPYSCVNIFLVDVATPTLAYHSRTDIEENAKGRRSCRSWITLLFAVYVDRHSTSLNLICLCQTNRMYIKDPENYFLLQTIS